MHQLTERLNQKTEESGLNPDQGNSFHVFSLFTMHTHTNDLATAFVNSRRIFQNALSPFFSILAPFQITFILFCIFLQKAKGKKNPLNHLNRRYIFTKMLLPSCCSSIILCSIKLPCSRSCADFEFPSIIRPFYSF